MPEPPKLAIFNVTDELRDHVLEWPMAQTSHVDSREHVVCPYCGRVAADVHHLRGATGVTNEIVCPECRKTFTVAVTYFGFHCSRKETAADLSKKFFPV